MTSVADVEHSLSRARLELMDKRKEIREVVHTHYADLISVSDHAIRMSEHIDSLSNTFSQMLSLTKALRVRMATSQLSHDISAVDGSHVVDNDENSRQVEAILSLNGRVLFYASRFEFDLISRIITEEFPVWKNVEMPPRMKSLCENELALFSNKTILRLCLKSLSLPTLQEESQLSACIDLLRLVTDNVDEKFWTMRTLLMEQLTHNSADCDLPTVMSVFDLSIACGSNQLAFESRFGAGFIGPRFASECSKFDLVQLSLRLEFTKKWTHTVKFLPIEQIVRETIHRLVGKRVPLNLHTANWNKTSFEAAFASIVREAQTCLSNAEDAWVWASVERHLELQRANSASEWLNVAKHANELDEEAIGETLQAMSRSALERYFETLAAEWVSILEQNNSACSVLPVHPSGAVVAVLMDAARKITIPMASVVAKRTLTKLLVSIYSKNGNLQTLFDLQFLILVLWSVEDDENHTILRQTVLPALQQRVLSDLVDRRLYAEPIKTAASQALHSYRGLLQVLLTDNPAAISNTHKAERQLQDTYFGNTHCAPFASLPVAKTVPRPTSGSVSSFFNQVGKITLGTTK